jgi:hypothetical protein
MAQLTNGQIVKLSDTAPVYLVLFGQACHVPSPQTATNLFGTNWGNYVLSVSQATLNTVPMGQSLTAGSCLVQGAGQAQIYLYTWGDKYWVTSMGALTTYHFNTGNLISGVNPQLIKAMPQGNNISG